MTSKLQVLHTMRTTLLVKHIVNFMSKMSTKICVLLIACFYFLFQPEAMTGLTYNMTVAEILSEINHVRLKIRRPTHGSQFLQ